MKRCIAFALCISLLFLTGCSLKELLNEEDEDESFSARFTIRETPQPTEYFVDENYTGITKAARSDSINISALRSLLAETVFGEEHDTVALWQDEIVYTLKGKFSEETASVVSQAAQEISESSGFPGIREGEAKGANVTISFREASAGFTYTTDEYGNLNGGTITIPKSLSLSEQEALLYRYFFRLTGFLEEADSEMDSILSSDPTDTPTEADQLLIDFLYSAAETGMTEDECMAAFDNFIGKAASATARKSKKSKKKTTEQYSTIISKTTRAASTKTK